MDDPTAAPALTLTGWLIEQIAADERAAQEAQDAPETEWRGPFDGLVGCYDLSVYEHTHIKRWLPARVLAECDAKRRLIAHWRDDSESLNRDGLPFLAAPYADRPGYREEWRG